MTKTVNFETMQLKIGQQFWVVLNIADAQNLYAIGGYFQYSPNLAEVMLSENMPVIETYKFFGEGEKVRFGLENNTQGTFGFTVTNGQQGGLSGAGRLIRVKMKVKAEGKISITGKMVEPMAPDGRVLSSKLTDVEFDAIKDTPPAALISIFFTIEPA